MCHYQIKSIVLFLRKRGVDMAHCHGSWLGNGELSVQISALQAIFAPGLPQK